MSALFHDIHQNDNNAMKKDKLWGANFHELLYADDTVLMTKTLEQMQELLHQVERTAANYGLTLNFNKCELITINHNQNS